VALSQGNALEGSSPFVGGDFTLSSQRPSVRETGCKTDGWLCLGEDSHVPHELDLDGLLDLDDLVVALSQGIALECLSPS
jgi:hypothetical protein